MIMRYSLKLPCSETINSQNVVKHIYSKTYNIIANLAFSPMFSEQTYFRTPPANNIIVNIISSLFFFWGGGAYISKLYENVLQNILNITISLQLLMGHYCIFGHFDRVFS